VDGRRGWDEEKERGEEIGEEGREMRGDGRGKMIGKEEN
jgi:hypothetical protein